MVSNLPETFLCVVGEGGGGGAELLSLMHQGGRESHTFQCNLTQPLTPTQAFFTHWHSFGR